jgi:hypothetical protein
MNWGDNHKVQPRYRERDDSWCDHCNGFSLDAESVSTQLWVENSAASVHRSIFHQLAVMEDPVGEELAGGFKIEAQLHTSRVRPRRGGAGLAARTMI